MLLENLSSLPRIREHCHDTCLQSQHRGQRERERESGTEGPGGEYCISGASSSDGIVQLVFGEFQYTLPQDTVSVAF